LQLESRDIARAIKGILEEAKMTSQKAVFSIPDFSTFYTTFDLPPMSLPEIPQAVRFQARQQIPLPLSEVSLDWSVIEGEIKDQQSSGLKILLVAVPNEIINQYQEIARLCRLELLALEAEVFGFLRSAQVDKRKTLALIDIGARSGTCSLVDRGVLKQSRSFEPAGSEITEVLAKSLQIDWRAAEDLKNQYGLQLQSEPEKAKIREVMLTVVDAAIEEIKKTFQSFSLLESRSPESVVLAGGLALLPGFKEYLAQQLGKDAEIVKPFTKIFYPPILEKTLAILGPGLSIAVGAALRGLE
jgi:type IV pilus assembly protein PilM